MNYGTFFSLSVYQVRITILSCAQFISPYSDKDEASVVIVLGRPLPTIKIFCPQSKDIIVIYTKLFLFVLKVAIKKDICNYKQRF